MSAANRARALTRWGAVGVMATAVLTATGGGFAQSYAGLYHWALEHGLTGWKADSFPLLVDLFIIVGELGLFLLALDAFVLHRRNMLSWVDFFLPLFIALAGWTASLVFNVGHVVQRDFSYKATAAVPPIVSMLGLFVLLRTLHRYVQEQEERATEAAPPDGDGDGNGTRAINPISLHRITLVPVQVMPQLPAGAKPGSAIESGTAGAAAPAARTATAAPGTGPVGSPVSVASAATAVGGMAGPGTADSVAHAPSAAAPSSAGPAGMAVGGTHSLPGQGLTGQGLDGHLAGNQATRGAEHRFKTVAGDDTDPEALRSQILSALGRNYGDVEGAHADLRAAGHHCSEEDVRRARENHWFPYAVYRLMAKHGGDATLVAKELTERGVAYDRTAFEGLVRAWRA